MTVVDPTNPENPLTLFDLNADDPNEAKPEYVRILDTHVGFGVFTVRPYPASSVIGEIKGRLIDDPNHGTEYTFDANNGQLLEPDEPFRFVNHSCEPNCEFDWLENPGKGRKAWTTRLYLLAIRDIRPDEQLTIAYNWPASAAIRCQCRAPSCRGWIVAKEELAKARFATTCNSLENNGRRG